MLVSTTQLLLLAEMLLYNCQS